MMKSPLARLLQGAGFSVGALVVGAGFGLVLTPYLVSCLGEENYGVYAIASLFAGWCGLLDFGLTTTTSRYVTRCFTKGDFEGLNETGSTAIILFGGISGVIFLLALGAFLTAKALGDSFDSTGFLGVALFFSGCSFALSKISDGYLGVLRGSLRQELTGGASFVFRILFGLLNFAILYFGGRVRALFAGNFVLTFVQLCAYVIMTRRAAPFFRFSLKSFRLSRVRTLFSYSFFAFLAQAGEIAVNRSDLIIIAALMTAADAGRYNLVVVTLASYFNSFLTEASSWETNWFARLAALERTEEDQRESSGSAAVSSAPGRFSDGFYLHRDRITRASIYASIFGAFGLLALGPSFIERWLGAGYLAVFPALAVCMAAQGLYRGASEVNARVLQGTARHRILGAGAALHGIVNIILSVWLVRRGWGLTGVALGSALPGLAIHYFWIPCATCRLIGERLRDYWGRQLRSTALALAALVLPWLCARQLCAPSYPRILLAGVLSALLYCGFLFLFAATAEERRLAIGFARRMTGRENREEPEGDV